MEKYDSKGSVKNYSKQRGKNLSCVKLKIFFVKENFPLPQRKIKYLPYHCRSQKMLHILEVLTSYSLVSLALKRHLEL